MSTPETKNDPEHRDDETTMATLMEQALDAVVVPRRDTKAAAIRACAPKINALHNAGATWKIIGEAIRSSGMTISDDHIRKVMEAYNKNQQNNNKVPGSQPNGTTSYLGLKNSKPRAIE